MSIQRDYNLRKAVFIADAVVHRYEHMSYVGYDKEGFPVLQDEIHKKKIKISVETVEDEEQAPDLTHQVEPKPSHQGVIRQPRNGFSINWQEMCSNSS